MKIRTMYTFWITAMFVCFASYGSANRKLVGSKDCIVSQYCEEENAIMALQTTFGMSEDAAASYIQNRTIVRSCSCHNSCVYLGLCCQDKQIVVPEEQRPIASRLMEDRSSYECRKTLERDTVVVHTCPPNAQAAMKQKCARVAELDLLVTSNVTFLTYKNIYCGLCNGERFEQLMPWSISYDCKFKTLPQGVTPDQSGGIQQQATNSGCTLNQTAPLIPPALIEIHHSVGVYMDTASLCSSPPVSTCPVGADKSHDCENRPVSLIFYGNKVYRNEHCLRCTEGSSAIAEAICESCEYEGCAHKELHSEDSFFNSFGILVQPYDDKDVVSCKTANEEDCGEILQELTTCGHGEYLEYQTATCKKVCPDGFQLSKGLCEFVEETCERYLDEDSYKDLSISNNSTKQLDGDTFIIIGETVTPCFTCKNLTAITKETEGFVIGQNDQITYKANVIGKNFIYNVDNMTYYVCLDDVLRIDHIDFTSEEIITTILLSMSIIGILLYFVAYLTFRRLRNIPGKVVAGNMLCLFLAYVLFLLRNLAEVRETSACSVIAIAIHYFFLASFIFNIIYAAFIVHSLDSMEYESNTTIWTALWMWVVGLLAPFLVIVPAIVLDYTPGHPLRPHYGGETCFISNGIGLTLYFIAPIGVSLMIAISLYIAIVVKLVRLAKETNMVRTDHSEKISIAIKLLVVLGFNWIFALVAAIDSGRITTFIFIVACALQGFFGFVVFLCNNTTLVDVKKCLNRKAGFNFEMSSSNRFVSKKSNKTVSSDGRSIKNPLHQKNSSTELLSAKAVPV
ncbi:uncharacterized protein [Watersipora subatra]|uniref:uncharacterized protein isoform X2 n=1 Tax=Watersipora subatra TaxID=2589382 RepID=UPI00355AF2B5